MPDSKSPFQERTPKPDNGLINDPRLFAVTTQIYQHWVGGKVIDFSGLPHRIPEGVWRDVSFMKDRLDQEDRLTVARYYHDILNRSVMVNQNKPGWSEIVRGIQYFMHEEGGSTFLQDPEQVLKLPQADHLLRNEERVLTLTGSKPHPAGGRRMDGKPSISLANHRHAIWHRVSTAVDEVGAAAKATAEGTFPTPGLGQKVYQGLSFVGHALDRAILSPAKRITDQLNTLPPEADANVRFAHNIGTAFRHAAGGVGRLILRNPPPDYIEPISGTVMMIDTHAGNVAEKGISPSMTPKDEELRQIYSTGRKPVAPSAKDLVVVPQILPAALPGRSAGFRENKGPRR